MNLYRFLKYIGCFIKKIKNYQKLKMLCVPQTIEDVLSLSICIFLQIWKHPDGIESNVNTSKRNIFDFPSLPVLTKKEIFSSIIYGLFIHHHHLIRAKKCYEKSIQTFLYLVLFQYRAFVIFQLRLKQFRVLWMDVYNGERFEILLYTEITSFVFEWY